MHGPDSIRFDPANTVLEPKVWVRHAVQKPVHNEFNIKKADVESGRCRLRHSNWSLIFQAPLNFMTDNSSPRLILQGDDLSTWQTTNQDAWDEMVQSGHRLATPAKDELFANPLKSIDSAGWLGPTIQGKHVLCLAAGGGRQGPLYAAAGSIVTVVDLSPAMLQLDRQVAAERGLTLQTVQTSMDDLRMLGQNQFDIVIHPVSTCYVPDVRPVYEQVARVLRSGGLYVSQHKQPINLQASLNPDGAEYRILHEYYRTSPIPPIQSTQRSPFREPGTTEYLHRWEQLIGGLCQSGFVVEDLLEPYHGGVALTPPSRKLRSRFISPYVRIKARRK